MTSFSSSFSQNQRWPKSVILWEVYSNWFAISRNSARTCQNTRNDKCIAGLRKFWIRYCCYGSVCRLFQKSRKRKPKPRWRDQFRKILGHSPYGIPVLPIWKHYTWRRPSLFIMLARQYARTTMKNVWKCEKKCKWCIRHDSSYSLCLWSSFFAICILSPISQLSSFLTKHQKNFLCGIKLNTKFIVYGNWFVVLHFFAKFFAISFFMVVWSVSWSGIGISGPHKNVSIITRSS